MKNRDLIAILQSLDPNAEVIISGTEVTGAEQVGGRIKDGYLTRTFLPLPSKPRDQAIVFIRPVELSDGTIADVRF